MHQTRRSGVVCGGGVVVVVGRSPATPPPRRRVLHNPALSCAVSCRSILATFRYYSLWETMIRSGSAEGPLRDVPSAFCRHDSSSTLVDYTAYTIALAIVGNYYCGIMQP
jgi:hypothetical protein